MYVVEMRVDRPLFWTAEGWSRDEWKSHEYVDRNDALSRAMRLRNTALEKYKDKIIVKAVP